ncbi:MAG: nitronate monooxygenase [Planctomycetota bacterium]|nr:MAG: nitronate monooxygenase [Planctomycetota bacterium]
MTQLPTIIQGGMGAGVSAWQLAQAVSKAGQLGVIAGTALDIILARRLQLGDPDGAMRRALSHFPIPGVAQRILDAYFVPGGKAANAPFKNKPLIGEAPNQALNELIVAGNYVEVFLAREGHDNPVGINYLEKIQVPTLPSIFGAMLAGVSFVLMGAGIPLAIPGILDRLAEGREVELRLDIKGALPDEEFKTRFDPAAFCGGEAPALERPRFLAIVSAITIANVMVRKASGKVDGFIIEGPTAGGHNAPPRGRTKLDEAGEPIYGKRDSPDLADFRALEQPFWLAGGFAGPQQLCDALAQGATGIQVGTAFAFSNESGIGPEWKAQVLQRSRAGEMRIFTDPIASPTGFPFKVLQLDETISHATVYAERKRICDLGYLRHGYRREDGKVGWRCPSEPHKDFERKGGELPDTEGRKCVCNGLLANIGMPQSRRDGSTEKPMLTAGDDAQHVARFLADGANGYSAQSVIDALLTPIPSST